MAKKKPRHGGARKGAGRKPLDPSGPKRRVTVCLSPAEVGHCQALGESVQAGVLRLIRASMARA